MERKQRGCSVQKAQVVGGFFGCSVRWKAVGSRERMQPPLLLFLMQLLWWRRQQQRWQLLPRMSERLQSSKNNSSRDAGCNGNSCGVGYAV
jgi:hypothetical protein